MSRDLMWNPTLTRQFGPGHLNQDHNYRNVNLHTNDNYVTDLQCKSGGTSPLDVEDDDERLAELQSSGAQQSPSYNYFEDNVTPTDTQPHNLLIPGRDLTGDDTVRMNQLGSKSTKIGSNKVVPSCDIDERIYIDTRIDCSDQTNECKLFMFWKNWSNLSALNLFQILLAVTSIIVILYYIVHYVIHNLNMNAKSDSATPIDAIQTNAKTNQYEQTQYQYQNPHSVSLRKDSKWLESSTSNQQGTQPDAQNEDPFTVLQLRERKINENVNDKYSEKGTPNVVQQQSSGSTMTSKWANSAYESMTSPFFQKCKEGKAPTSQCSCADQKVRMATLKLDFRHPSDIATEQMWQELTLKNTAELAYGLYTSESHQYDSLWYEDPQTIANMWQDKLIMYAEKHDYNIWLQYNDFSLNLDEWKSSNADNDMVPISHKLIENKGCLMQRNIIKTHSSSDSDSDSDSDMDGVAQHQPDQLVQSCDDEMCSNIKCSRMLSGVKKKKKSKKKKNDSEPDTNSDASSDKKKKEAKKLDNKYLTVVLSKKSANIAVQQVKGGGCCAEGTGHAKGILMSEVTLKSGCKLLLVGYQISKRMQRNAMQVYKFEEVIRKMYAPPLARPFIVMIGDANYRTIMKTDFLSKNAIQDVGTCGTFSWIKRDLTDVAINEVDNNIEVKNFATYNITAKPNFGPDQLCQEKCCQEQKFDCKYAKTVRNRAAGSGNDDYVCNIAQELTSKLLSPCVTNMVDKANGYKLKKFALWQLNNPVGPIGNRNMQAATASRLTLDGALEFGRKIDDYQIRRQLIQTSVDRIGDIDTVLMQKSQIDQQQCKFNQVEVQDSQTNEIQLNLRAYQGQQNPEGIIPTSLPCVRRFRQMFWWWADHVEDVKSAPVPLPSYKVTPWDQWSKFEKIGQYFERQKHIQIDNVLEVESEIEFAASLGEFLKLEEHKDIVDVFNNDNFNRVYKTKTFQSTDDRHEFLTSIYTKMFEKPDAYPGIESESSFKNNEMRCDPGRKRYVTGANAYLNNKTKDGPSALNFGWLDRIYCSRIVFDTKNNMLISPAPESQDIPRIDSVPGCRQDTYSRTIDDNNTVFAYDHAPTYGDVTILPTKYM